MRSIALLSILVLAIAFALAFIVSFVRKNFFVEKDYYIASNTARGFALFADFLFLNSLNLIYRLVKAYVDPIYRDKFQAFAEKTFHSGGVGLGDWFWHTQTLMLAIYIVYSLISELIIKSTPLGYFLGLRLRDSTPIKIVLRNVLKPISIILWPLGALLSNLNKKRMWLHDLFFGIAVIQEK